MNKPIDWATSRVEMLLVGIFGEDWRFKLGDRRRIGNRVVDTSSELLRVLAGALRETAQLGPRMHECNHPTDSNLCDNIDYLQSLGELGAPGVAEGWWCTRCGALGETSMEDYGRGNFDRVGWRRPEAPLSPNRLETGLQILLGVSSEVRDMDLLALAAKRIPDPTGET